jgi:hypothetical protein
MAVWEGYLELQAAASVLLAWGRPVQAIAGDRKAPPVAIHFTWADADYADFPVGVGCDTIDFTGYWLSLWSSPCSP